MRSLVLLFIVVVPGITVSSVCTFYLFPEWAALDTSYKYYERVTKSSPASMPNLFIAQAAENRHRINCFAEGVGVLLGGAIAAIGIHGICTLPKRQS